MHGCRSASHLVVNAEVDSMGGVVEGGVGVGTKNSPRRAAIEKVQAVLRQEYDVREERRRELEFLEKGGNPLDFKYGNTASVSVQSTSLTDQHHEIFLTSEAKGSFAITASPHGDSVESSGRPGAHSACEPNSADNLMLFDGENDSVEVDRNSRQPSKKNSTLAEHSFPSDGNQNAKEIVDPAGFGRSRKAYIRRNRSRTNRDGGRSSSTDVLLPRGGHGSSLTVRHGLKDSVGLISEENNQKIQKISSNGYSPTSSDVVRVSKTLTLHNQLDIELDGVKTVESNNDQVKDVRATVMLDVSALKTLHDGKHNSELVSDVQKANTDKDFSVAEPVKGPEDVSVSERVEIEPCLHVTQVENPTSSGQDNGFGTHKGDDKSAMNDGRNSTAELGTKVLDSESSCNQTSFSLDGNNSSVLYSNLRNNDSNGIVKEHIPVLEAKPPMEGVQTIKEAKEVKVDESSTSIHDECNSGQGSHKENGFMLKSEEEINGNASSLQDKVKNQNQTEVEDKTTDERMEADGNDGSEREGKKSILLSEDLNAKDGNLCADSSIIKLPETDTPAAGVSLPPEGQMLSDINVKTSKADEDSILKEARIIEAKHKRIAELSVATLPMDFRRKSQWDYVLEEMAWLANDFAQERLWKITSAAQVCHRVALASRLRFHEQNNCFEHKRVARILARAVMEFWHSGEEIRKQQQMQCCRKESLALQQYVARFLKYNNSDILHGQAEAPVTPDRVSDLGIVDMSLDDYLTEENIFYSVPPFAAENYRNSIESHVIRYEKTGSSIQEEVETSAYDAIADFGCQDNPYEEDEGETSTYDASMAFDAVKSSRFSQKRWKNSTKAYSGRTFEVVADSQFMQCVENKVSTQHPVLGKRPASSLNVSFPTKRVRTSNRQRISPFSAGTSAYVPIPHKTDASSGDTNSFQDDHSTLHGGSHAPNNLEVDSVSDFEKSLPFDSAEVSTKSKKKKKGKHLGSAYDQRWHVDSNFQNEQFQREHSRKRSEVLQLESNGSSGLFGQHIAKKQKIMRSSLDISYDNTGPVSGSAPSPVASQISNPNRLIRYFGGRDRGGRKNKALKLPANQLDSGSPWTSFEEQALVVLVHDLGPNWELVSDALNSLQFKCTFHNPKECKERYKLVVDRPSGDGADSADDSGSSQIYESTLAGIPKGSARHLFQQLHGPMEEDTLKSHFEKIIMIGQKLHRRRKQNECQDPKQLQPPHGSHMLALTQVCPNNLNGGPVLTPVDLCDAMESSPDLPPLNFQGPHGSGLTISSPGTMAPIFTASGANSAGAGSSSVLIGNNLSSSIPVSGSVRDGRYSMARSASLSIDEQQRMQQYNHMLSNRNIPQSNVSSPGALPGNDRGVRMLPGGNGIAMSGGINRSLPIARPGFQGMTSSPMLNSGSMISTGMVAMASPVNMHTGVGSGQGNTIRPRDPLHLMRPGQNQDPQRQMMAPELQMQVSQGNNQGVPPFGALSSSFPNQTVSPPVSSYSIHHQQSQAMSPQQPHVSSPHHSHLQGTNQANNQAYAIRLAKERHIHQRLMQQQQQQQQQFASSNSMMVQQGQIPISPLPQSSSHINTPTVSLSPLTSASPMTTVPQHQQKHQVLPPGLARSSPSGSSGLTSQVGKQRQRQSQQQFQQASRHHPQPRQQTQSQQQAKALKGVGRGNILIHQNISMDPSLLNGLSSNPGNQSAEKGDQTMHLLPGQNLYAGSTLNSVQSGKSVAAHSSNQSQAHQKIYSGQASPMPKHLQQMPSHSDNVNQGHNSPAASGPPLSAGPQSVSPMALASSSHLQPQLQPHQKLPNQSQPNVQRVLQNRHVNSEPSARLQGRESQVDQSPMGNSPQMGAVATMSKASNDITSVKQVVSSAGGAQWRASESYDSATPNPATNLSCVRTPPTNSASNEPSSQAGHVLGQRQSSGSLPPVGHDVSTQWQQQQQQQQSPSPASQQQQQASPQQLPLPSHLQQQAQLVGNSSLFVRPTDSRLE